MNSINIIGRLTRTPDVRTTSNGKKVANFTVAVNKPVKPTNGEPDAYFFNVAAFGQTAEFIESYLDKGRLVSVSGSLTQRKYQDKDGNNREAVEIVADRVQGLDRPRDDAPTTATGRTPRDPANASVAGDDWDPFGDE